MVPETINLDDGPNLGLIESLQSRFRQEYELRCHFDYVEARFSTDVDRGYLEDTVAGTAWRIVDVDRHRGEWPDSTATLVTFDREGGDDV